MITAKAIRLGLQCDNPSCDCHKPSGNVHCPAHADSTPSLSVTEKNGKPLVKCHGGCGQDKVIAALKEKNLWYSGKGKEPRARRKSLGEPVKVYDYRDADGKLVYQVCRYRTSTGKTFRQRRPDGKGGWVWKMKGVHLVPYRLLEILKAETVYIPEGEEDCNNLAAMGLTATTNPGGAMKWRPDYNHHFKGKAVVILPDNDDVGRAHAQNVARNLHGVAASVKTVELPGLPEKGDVSDWLNGGGTREQLLVLTEAAQEFDPVTAPEAKAPTPIELEAKPTQQEILLRIASAAELFHTADEDGYGIIPIKAHRETWSIRSRGFRRFLAHEFYKLQGKGPQAEAISSALQVLEARAQFDGPERPVWVRIAEHQGAIYLDLCNEAWEAVKITQAGWEVVADPPVCFRRTRGMTTLPYPVRGGSVNELRPFLNVWSDADFILMVAFLIEALRPRGPYPIPVLNGEQGSAKSTTARIMRALIDPCTSLLRSSPREVRDLMIGASNSWILGFDNLSSIPYWLSDALCRLSTGGGFSTRELYTDRDEIIFEATRPIILNGIDNLTYRQDLADRSLIFNLPQIADEDRRPESQFWTDFEVARPHILGALLDAVSMALQNIDTIKLPALPRMADFAMWVTAAEPALPWCRGSFMEAYVGNRAEAVELSLEADCVAVAVREYMAHKNEWTGKASELYKELEKLVPDNTKRDKAWPKAANRLSGRLKQAATFLRATGLDIEIGWSKSTGRKIVLRRVAQSVQSTVGTVGTVGTEKPCLFSSHDTKNGTVGIVESTVESQEPRGGSSHDTDGPSHDTEKEPWEEKVNNNAAFHDTHDTHDTLHTTDGEVEELEF